MENQSGVIDHRKRRRRRRPDKPPISGWLQPSEQVNGNVGVIAHALHTDLFGNTSSYDIGASASDATDIHYVGLTSWPPSSQNLVEDATWTILPVRAQTSKEEEASKLKSDTIRFSASSCALQTFSEALQATPGGKSGITGQSGVEVRILPVEPLKLATVYINVDGDALNKHDEVQKRFGGGFVSSSTMNGSARKNKKHASGSGAGQANGIGKESEKQVQDDQLAAAVREAVRVSRIVRQNDLIPLPLPAHPITHVPLPPAKIALCNPVSQGLLSNATNIVVNRVYHTNPGDRKWPSLTSKKAYHAFTTEEDNGTSGDQFFSATEGNEVSESDAPETSSDSDEEGTSDSSSDDSMGNMISMGIPPLVTQSSSVLSTRTAATPRASGPRANGINTPGSVYSNFTTTTARQGTSSRKKAFKVQSLMQKIPDDMLHPQPSAVDDDEARVYVDMKWLVKIGCYSGDWVKLEAVSSLASNTQKVWGLEALNRDEDAEDFRPLRIYGLADLQAAPSIRNSKPRNQDRRSSIISLPSRDQVAMTAWISPILMANLGQPSSVRLSALSTVGRERQYSAIKKTKFSISAMPPIAREMILLRVSTPLSTERALQTGLFTALKQHFEERSRILHQGDLIALLVDVGASRLLAQSGQVAEPDNEIEELLSIASQSQTAMSLEVAWFKVGHIVGAEDHEDHEDADFPSEVWGGAACIDPRMTRLRQAGSEQSRIPSTSENTWQFYLGTKHHSKMIPSNQADEKWAGSLQRPYISRLRRRLRELIAAATSPRAIHLGMDSTVILLHSSQRSIGKATIASRVASDLGLHIFEIDAYEILAEGAGGGDVKTEAFLKARVERAMSCGTNYTVVLIRHVEALSANRMAATLREVASDVRILIATSTELDKVTDGVRSLFTHEMEFTAPDEGEREGVLREIIRDRDIRLGDDVNLSAVAVKTAALVAGNLVDIVDRALVARHLRLEGLVRRNSSDQEQAEIRVQDLLISGGQYARCVVKADFDTAVEAARKNFADAIGAPKIPNVSWDDVGGLENVKDAVMETIQLPLERPELFAKGMKKRSGILFYGPPGTGKTLLAKAIATEFSLNFFSVKGPELLNMYIGESEANVRRVFQRARDARPCVVFFDELDSVAPKRGNQGDSGGVMDRIVSQLLAELDGISDGEEGGGGVFVIGATNRPDLLDQALLRPGRFDKMLYLGVSDTHEKQLTILEALTRNFTMHPKMSLRRVADTLPFTYTGADLYALCSDAMLKAITRQASAVDTKIKALPRGPVTPAYFFDHLATREDIAVMVTEDDFISAQRELVGSVSAKELEHYQRVRHTFEGPAKLKSSRETSIEPRKLMSAPGVDGHIHPPVPTKRPKPPNRNTTARLKPPIDKKGKGKATKWDSDEDDDDAYVTSNDFGTPERRKSVFEDVGADDDEMLYS